MILVFDTETTGFPSSALSVTHPGQARVCQLAMLLLDDKLNEVASLSTLIFPSGWTIPESATKVHGITLEMCQKFGTQMRYVENIFNDWYYRCNKIIAHNIAFDKQMINIERGVILGTSDYEWNHALCTMTAMAPICKLPGKYRGATYKWPKLMEAYTHCFGQMFDKAHDALADVRATAKILGWLVNNKHITI